VAPVGAEFVDENRDEKLRPTREREQGLLERRINEEADRMDESEGDEEREELADAAGDEEVGDSDVGPDAGALPKLPTRNREQRLERDEEHDEAEEEAGGLRGREVGEQPVME